MPGNHNEIQDLMRRFGYKEREAEAAYHLRRAWDLFDELYDEWFAGETIRQTAGLVNRRHDVTPHFDALFNLLARSVLADDYPEGWGRGSARDLEEDPGE